MSYEGEANVEDNVRDRESKTEKWRSNTRK